MPAGRAILNFLACSSGESCLKILEVSAGIMRSLILVISSSVTGLYFFICSELLMLQGTKNVRDRFY